MRATGRGIGFIEIGQDALAIAEEVLADLGEPHAACAALQKLRAQPLLERADRTCDRRRREAELSR